MFGLQDGANRDTILNDLKDQSIDYLVNGSKLVPNEERAKHLAETFAGLVQAPFNINSMSRSSDKLDPRLKENVFSFIETQSKATLEMLLDGYLNQFEIETQRALIITLARIGYRGRQPRNWIIQEFTDHWKGRNIDCAKFAFDRMWRQVKNRKLNIGKYGLALLEVRSRRQNGKLEDYHEQLGKILRVLQPEMSTSERKKWRIAWLNRSAEKLRLDRACLGAANVMRNQQFC